MVLAELGKENLSGSKKIKKDDFGVNDEDWEVYRGISRHTLSEDEEEDVQNLNEIEGQIIELDPNYLKFNDNYDNLTQKYLYLGVDQFRGAELVFQPSIIGIDQTGLLEAILNIFSTLKEEEKKILARNIFLTGGNVNFKNFEQRLKKDLRENLNCDFEINIKKVNYYMKNRLLIQT
jgi:actin-related protein 5